jgi:hypothetical protein
VKKSDALTITTAFPREAERTEIPAECAPLAITFAAADIDPEHWLLYRNTAKLLETKRDEDMIIGQARAIVPATGRLLDRGSAESVSMVLKRFGVERSAQSASPSSGGPQ